MRNVAPRFLTCADIHAAVDAHAVLTSQADAFRLAADPSVTSAQGHATSPDGYLLFLHGARLPDGTTVFKSGVQGSTETIRELEPVSASVTVHDAHDGRLTYVLDGPTVTALRTAGGLLQCLLTLQHGSAEVLGVLGSGRQARELRRLAEELGLWKRVLIWSPSLSAGANPHSIPPESIARDAQDLCRRADTIACCTASSTPVLQADWLRENATVGTMGSYMSDRCETGPDITQIAAAVVTDAASAITSVGPLVEGFALDLLTPGDVELMADILSADAAWSRPEGVVLVHCSGLGVQDATLGKAVVDSTMARTYQ